MTSKTKSSPRKPERNTGGQRSDGPRRMCVACRERRHPDDLVRIRLDSDGSLRVNTLGPTRGRGAWICPRPKCLDALTRRPGRLVRAFRHRGRLDVADLAVQVRRHAMSEAHHALWAARRAGLCRELAGPGARATSHPRLLGLVSVACPPPPPAPATEVWKIDALLASAEEPLRSVAPGVFVLLEGAPTLRARRWLRRLALLG